MKIFQTLFYFYHNFSNPRGTKMGTWFSPSNSLLIDQQPQINHHVEHYPSFQDNSQTHYQR